MENDKFSALANTARNLYISSDDEQLLNPTSEFSEALQAAEKKKEEEEKASNTRRDVLATDETGWDSQDSLYAAQRFFSSAALGWGDELGLWAAAAVASQVEGTPVKEVYADMRKRYDAQQEKFKEKHKGVALGTDIGGALASPATYLATPLAAASRVGQTGSLFARAGAEGAIYGAGEAGEGKRTEGAVEGAKGGLIGAGLVKGTSFSLGKTVDAISKRRVEGDLVDEAGNFVPITLAASDPKGAEGLIHSFYRDVVAVSFGAKGIIREQEDVIINKVEKAIESQNAFSKKLSEGVKEKQKQIQQQLRNAENALKEEGRNLKSAKKEQIVKDKIVPLETKLATLKNKKAEEITAKALSDTQKTLDAQRLNFRNETFINAFPEGATTKDVEKVLKINDIGARAKELDNLWNNKGYSMIKNKTFRFKSGELEKNLESVLQNDPYFKVNTVDIPAVMNIFNMSIENVNFFKDPSGRVQGDVVSSLRARIGSFANQAIDPQNRRAYYTLQDEIDKIMKSQLTPTQKKAFEKESGRWKTTVILREAIESANVDPKKRGNFDEADWIKEVSKNNRWDARYGTGPLYRTALNLETNLKSVSKSVAKRATNIARAKASLVEKEIKEHRKELASALSKIDNNLASKKIALSKNPELTSEIALDISRKEKATAEMAQLDKTLKELSSLRTPNSGWFHTLAAFAILSKGFQVGGVSGAMTAAGLALGTAATLTAPTAQRIVAGQTPTQQSIQRMLTSDATGKTAEILGRMGGAAGSRTGVFTE